MRTYQRGKINCIWVRVELLNNAAYSGCQAPENNGISLTRIHFTINWTNNLQNCKWVFKYHTRRYVALMTDFQLQYGCCG